MSKDIYLFVGILWIVAFIIAMLQGDLTAMYISAFAAFYIGKKILD